ncbi:ribosomal maturation YjgA family protein [Streptomyces liangshanensis]|uniref:ribosomal maturation YjgA family protein n=1 Tax=Streptomyces liangshanensis TaxID=2717324 RepID=UPI0036D8C760
MGVVLGTRLVALVGAAVTVAAGLGVRAWGGGDFAKYAGDALYTVLVHALVVCVVPRVRPRVAAVGAFAFSCGVELLQLTPVPAGLAARSGLARLVLGSTFNAPDLLWYAVGAGAAAVLHSALARSAGRVRRPVRPPDPPSGLSRRATGGRSTGP